MMNPEKKQKWLEGLRSGKFHQIFGLYSISDNDCCALGVNLAVNHNLIKRRDFFYDDGISEIERIKIARMNDEDKKSFNEIADWIEANL